MLAADVECRTNIKNKTPSARASQWPWYFEQTVEGEKEPEEGREPFLLRPLLVLSGLPGPGLVSLRSGERTQAAGTWE